MKVLVIAPTYRPGGGPSNSLYFLRYINGSKLLFYANSILSKDEDGIRVLMFPNMNHYVTSRVVKHIVDKFRPDYIISISPELMIHLKEKELERSVVILQGVLEPIIFKFEPLATFRTLFIYSEISYISRDMTYAAISIYMYRRISEIFRPKKVGLIYNPIREMFFKLGDERVQGGLVDCDRCKLRLLYVGVLKRLKGVDKLIRFFPSVLREFRDAELHIVGDGPLRGYLSYLVQKLGLLYFVGAFISGLFPLAILSVKERLRKGVFLELTLPAIIIILTPTLSYVALLEFLTDNNPVATITGPYETSASIS